MATAGAGPAEGTPIAWRGDVSMLANASSPTKTARPTRPALSRSLEVALIIGLVVVATATPFLARRFVLPGAEPPPPRKLLEPVPASARAAWSFFEACQVWPFRTAYGAGLDPYVRALGIASALALVASSVCGRKLRGGAGAAILGVALAGTLAATVATWPVRLPPSLAAVSICATLAHVGLGLVVARWTGVSVIGLAVVLERAVALTAIGVAFTLIGPATLDTATFLVQAVALVAPFAAGVALVRRYRIAGCDLSGAFSPCVAPAELALLPVAWMRVGQSLFAASHDWTRGIAPGIAAALDTPLAQSLSDLVLAAASIVTLALVLRARERRDRALVG
jgi:hypothetical protein